MCSIAPFAPAHSPFLSISVRMGIFHVSHAPTRLKTYVLLVENYSKGMEKVLESMGMSCKNMEHGCMKKISLCKKLDHENSCKYTPDPCPIVGCKYVGAGKSFYDHYVEKLLFLASS